MNSSGEQRLIHDINSSMSAISQALELVKDNFDDDRLLSKKIILLANSKMSELLVDWEALKGLIKE